MSTALPASVTAIAGLAQRGLAHRDQLRHLQEQEPEVYAAGADHGLPVGAVRECLISGREMACSSSLELNRAGSPRVGPFAELFPLAAERFADSPPAIRKKFPAIRSGFPAHQAQGICRKPLRQLQKVECEWFGRGSNRKTIPAIFPAGRETRLACLRLLHTLYATRAHHSAGASAGPLTPPRSRRCSRSSSRYTTGVV
jgi:hypothetical protein